MYVTDSEYTTYATAVGVTLPTDEADRTIQLVTASRFIDSQESRLMGTRTERDQDYAYPRFNLYINGYYYDTDEIPEIVKKCQMEFALEVNAGVDLFDRGYDLPVIKERVEGAIEVQYASPNGVAPALKQSNGMRLLQQLISSNASGVRLVRS